MSDEDPVLDAFRKGIAEGVRHASSKARLYGALLAGDLVNRANDWLQQRVDELNERRKK